MFTFLSILQSPGLPTIGAYQNLTTVLPFDINNVPLFDTSGSQSLLSTALDTQQLKFQFVINSKGHVKVWGFSTPSYLVSIIPRCTWKLPFNCLFLSSS